MRFPLFALVVPVITSLVLWMVTGSTLTLLFAILGPVMALAQFVDGKIHARKDALRNQQQENDLDLARLAELQNTKTLERDSLLKKYPPSSFYAQPGNFFRPHWSVVTADSHQESLVRIGTRVRDGYPVVIDFHAGIAVEASMVEAKSIVRALGFQIAWRLGEEAMTAVGWDIDSEPELMSWGVLPAPSECKIYTVSPGQIFPAAVTYALRSHAGRAELTNLIDHSAEVVHFDVDLCTRAEANLILDTLQAEKLMHDQLMAPSHAIPDIVDSVLGVEGTLSSSRESLVVHVGRDAQHPLLVDLVEAGPHAVVCGMTGSGKTEFLRAWLLAMMSMYSPHSLNILLIDYKGGIGLSAFAHLPHVTGSLTDLSNSSTQRAMTALRAEIRFRENILAQAGVGHITELKKGIELPRLLVVIDEYRVLLEECPESVSVFTDLAARGRSLGIHLILATQRTGGVVADSVLANCALRICFRVNDKNDSLTMVDNLEAFELPHHPGRGVILGTALKQRQFQSACVSAADIDSVVTQSQKWMEEHPQWRSRPAWLPELPSRIDVSDIPHKLEGSSWLGLVDIPEHHEQQWTPYSPETMGNLLIRGPSRSGKSSVLNSLHQQLGGVVLRDAELAWDAVVESPRELFRPGTVVFIDEIEEILSHFDMDHADAFVLALTRHARVQQQHGGAVVLSCCANPRGVQKLLDHFPLEVQLTSSHSPGRGMWNGHEIQIATGAPQVLESGQWESFSCDPCQEYLIVTNRKNLMQQWLTEAFPHRVITLNSDISVSLGSERNIVVGTVEEWMMSPRKLVTEKADMVIVLDGCLTHELRGLRLRAGLFPYAAENTVLILDYVGQISRAQCSLD